MTGGAPSIQFGIPEIKYIMIAEFQPRFTVIIKTAEGKFEATAASIPLALCVASAEWWQAVAVAGGIPKR